MIVHLKQAFPYDSFNINSKLRITFGRLFSMRTGKISWPPGQYALPMPKAGCPDNWFEGRRFHDTSGTLLIDQKIYESLHLAGWISKEGIL